MRAAIQQELAAAQDSFNGSFAEYSVQPALEVGVRRHSWMDDDSSAPATDAHPNGERPRSRGITASIAATLGSPFGRSVCGAPGSSTNSPRAVVLPGGASASASPAAASAVMPFVNEEALCDRLSSSMPGLQGPSPAAHASQPLERDVEMGLSLAALDERVAPRA